ncbi:MAG: thiamine ABC transporter substrate binding subunit [Alphaproteobacteria bacterium]|nr:MAG: thiamine ABC transporter substrate binding subunit [Alphaproteobacteria bacterium]
MRLASIAAGLLALAGPVMADEKPVLTVYTYDSFVSDWGPGPAVEAAFEETCGCDLKFVGTGDGAALLARLRLEGARTDADVVLGLDTNLTHQAAETGLFAPHGVEVPDLDLPIAWDDPLFLPYDWGYFAFVYDKTRVTDVPHSFPELAESDLRIVIEDPRSSTPGLGLLLWVKTAYGDDAERIWQGLADNIVTVTKGWSEAYGMFLDGEADMVLSYTTSPAYHLIAEEDDSKAAAAFDEGHYMQVEVAGKVAGTDQPALADAFLEFMLSDRFQSIIPTTNWMYPARVPADGLPKGFETLVKPSRALLLPADKAAAVRDQALGEWLAALSR